MTVPLDEDEDQALLAVPSSDLAELSWADLRQKYGVKKAHFSSFTEESFQELVRRVGLSVEAVDFTYDYRRRQFKGVGRLARLWRWMSEQLGERFLCTAPGRMIIKAVHIVLFVSEGSKHHILVRAVKR